MIKFCEVCAIELKNAGSHYHCANCWDLKPVSMVGHYKVDPETGKGGFTCEKADKPIPFCNQCGTKYTEHCDKCAECPNEDCAHKLTPIDLVEIEEENDDHSELY